MTANRVVRILSLLALVALACATPSPTSSTVPAPKPASSTVPAPKPASAGAADAVVRLLTGRFDSADQARSSPGFSATQVVACPADVPALGPRALYVEQARMESPDSPERQRVLVIEPGEPIESAAVARVFELAVAGSSVGACGLARPPRFTREELVERVGCAMSLRSDATVWRGSTSGRGCPGALRGATYVTSEVVLDTLGYRAWDRGYDARGTLRFGESGPYLFVRRTPLSPP